MKITWRITDSYEYYSNNNEVIVKHKLSVWVIFIRIFNIWLTILMVKWWYINWQTVIFIIKTCNIDQQQQQPQRQRQQQLQWSWYCNMSNIVLLFYSIHIGLVILYHYVSTLHGLQSHTLAVSPGPRGKEARANVTGAQSSPKMTTKLLQS